MVKKTIECLQKNKIKNLSGSYRKKDSCWQLIAYACIGTFNDNQASFNID